MLKTSSGKEHMEKTKVICITVMVLLAIGGFALIYRSITSEENLNDMAEESRERERIDQAFYKEVESAPVELDPNARITGTFAQLVDDRNYKNEPNVGNSRPRGAPGIIYESELSHRGCNYRMTPEDRRPSKIEDVEFLIWIRWVDNISAKVSLYDRRRKRHVAMMDYAAKLVKVTYRNRKTGITTTSFEYRFRKRAIQDWIQGLMS